MEPTLPIRESALPIREKTPTSTRICGWAFPGVGALVHCCDRASYSATMPPAGPFTGLPK